MDRGVTVWGWCIVLMAIPSFFVYIYIISMLIYHKCKQKHLKSCYYNLMISQGITDIVSTNSQLLFEVGLQTDWLASIAWSRRGSRLAAWSYLHMFVFILARTLGIVMIVIQVCLSVTRHQSSINRLLNSIPGICFCLFHGTISILLAFPIMYETKNLYFKDETLKLAVDEKQDHAMWGNVWYTLYCTLSLFLLSLIIFLATVRVFCHNSNEKLAVKQEEKSHMLHAGTLLIQLLIAVSFFVVTVAENDDTNFPESFQDRFSLFSALLSYITPWYLICYNPHIRNFFRRCTKDGRGRSANSITGTHLVTPSTGGQNGEANH